MGTTKSAILEVQLNKRSIVIDGDLEKIEYQIENFTKPEYRAPEQILLSPDYWISEKVDIWALGVILYKMMFLKEEFVPVTEDNLTVEIPDSTKYSKPLRNLLRKLFKIDPEERPSITQVSKYVKKLLNGEPIKAKKTKRENDTSEEEKDVTVNYTSEEETKVTINDTSVRLKEIKPEPVGEVESEKLLKSQIIQGITKINGSEAILKESPKAPEVPDVPEMTETVKEVSINEKTITELVKLATENENSSPNIQVISTLVLRAWKNEDDIYDFYNKMKTSDYSESTIVALKALACIHRYILWGPGSQQETIILISKIHDWWKERIDDTDKNEKLQTEYPTEIIVKYSKILLRKVELYKETKHLFSQSYCLDRYFIRKDTI